jgi:hypothetical protein
MARSTEPSWATARNVQCHQQNLLPLSCPQSHLGRSLQPKPTGPANNWLALRRLTCAAAAAAAVRGSSSGPPATPSQHRARAPGLRLNRKMTEGA